MSRRIHIPQSRPGEEGLACLAICSSILGERYQLRDLRTRAPVSLQRLRLQDLLELAVGLGFAARIVRCDSGQARNLPSPTILEWELSGFVVFEGMAGQGQVRIFDPISGERKVSAAELARKQGAFGLEILSCPPMTAHRQRPRLTAASLIRWTPPVRNALIQCLVVSLFLQGYVLVSPFFMRAVVDDVVVNSDLDLLLSAALGFGVLAVFNAGAMALRGISIRQLSVNLSWDLTRRVFHHMLRLPLEWFQKRRLGDVLARLQGVDQVQTVLTGGLGALLDGVLSIVTIGMLTVLSPSLAIVAGVGFGLYVALRILGIPITMRLTQRSVVAAGVEQGKRIETLWAIQSVKTFAAENARESDWAGTLAESIRTSQDAALANNYFSSLQSLASLLTNVVAIYLGARAVLAGTMTVGLLTAALAYLTQFSQRASSLFEQLVSWRMLDVQLDRLEDVVLEEVEAGLDKPLVEFPKILGSLTVQDLKFQYGPQDPFLFENLTLQVEQGEHVAIVGPSGCGKSTLLKLIIGLYQPTSGTVMLDGRPLREWGALNARRAMGVVMQDDRLLAGSIAENVAFFDDRIAMDEVWKCLAMAGIEDEVRALPMLADTFINDMGSMLSGGQRQRLMIARALYRRPKILILDEATSHLDVAKERSIVETLRALRMTRIVVAHRPDTIAAADRVVRLHVGKLHPVENPVRTA